MAYSNEEKFDMLALYLQSNRNADVTSAKYLETYPERRQPHKTQFRKLVVNLINYGAFQQPKDQYNIENENRDQNILKAVIENPKISVRTVERELQLSKSTVHRKPIFQDECASLKGTLQSALKIPIFQILSCGPMRVALLIVEFLINTIPIIG
ncbi:hypothetical protein ABEB36_007964 [Hypothenemus hampei]|uniref:DUF4817 domain-containing protein n=1 Tax=Hypothenemus hampei TaxID=57062 RepID=A0ABD1EWQ9_HYPHA